MSFEGILIFWSNAYLTFVYLQSEMPFSFSICIGDLHSHLQHLLSFHIIIIAASKYCTVIGPAKYNVRNKQFGLEGLKYSMAHKQPGDIITGPPNNIVQPSDTHGMLVCAVHVSFLWTSLRYRYYVEISTIVFFHSFHKPTIYDSETIFYYLVLVWQS